MADKSAASFVLVHGAFHSSAYWELVSARLNAAGYDAQALDLPGAGQHAAFPAGYHPRAASFDAQTATTHVNGIRQQQRTQAVVDAVEAATAAMPKRPVVLVAHSFGGATATHAAEALGDKLAAVVYLTAFMLPHGWTAMDCRDSPAMADDGTKTLVVSGPPAIQAVRIDFRSPDAAYQARVKNVFGHDVPAELWEAQLAALHPDEALEPFTVKSPATAERYGRLPRHYIRCTEDRCISLAGQDFIIRLMDESGVGGRTVVHDLCASHSAMMSQPEQLATILEQIARTVSASGGYQKESE